jgi:2-polyprenyl-6-methoxyphenol hydroxylase-like FAD-dependent oxidoreductase
MAVPNFFRKPFGPGWALVGDAGYNKDFITAQGISDAFRDAELCAAAIDESLSGARPFEDAMSGYQSTRDEHVMPFFDFTCQFARIAPAPPEMQQVLAAVHGNPEAMEQFVKIFAGITSPAEFFSEENVGRIFAEAQSRAEG